MNCSENILEKVSLHILALDGSKICVTYFIKEICAPLNNQTLTLQKKNFPQIRNILLANNNPNNQSLPSWYNYWDRLLLTNYQ